MGEKSSIFVAIATGLTMGLWAPNALAIDDGPTLESVLTVTTDADAGLNCVVSISVDKTGLADGLQVNCTGNDASSRSFTLDELKAGVPLDHQASKNIDVMTLAIPDLDPAHGGTIKLHYLQDYIGKKYQDWEAQAENNGGQWTLYTSSDNGQEPFNTLFAAKHTFFGKVVGIKSIQTS
jgi:hypothetical protein